MCRKILLFFLLSGHAIWAQSPSLIWTYRMGGEWNHHANSMAVDQAGDIYTTGTFSGTLDFDPSPSAIFNLTSAGNTDVFLVKTNAAGSFQWALRLGNSGSNDAACIHIDPQGNLILAGTFIGTMDFDPGPGVYILSKSSSSGIFILTLTASGNFIRVAHFASASEQQNPSVSVDLSGNMYIAGEFKGPTDFNPDTSALATFILTASLVSSDLFVCKLDSTGAFIWAVKLGSVGAAETVRNLKADQFGNLLLAGSYTSGAFDFDPGSGVVNLPSATAGAVYILKLDTAANFKWVRAFSGNNYLDIPWDIDVDNQGNVLTLGQFRDTLDLDPSPGGTFLLTDPGGLHQVFLSKLDSMGQFVWAGSIGGAGDDFGYSFTLDDSSNIYMTGHCISNAALDLDPGSGVDTVPGGSTFIVKLDSACLYRWGVRIGGTVPNEYGSSIAIDDDYNVVTTGLFNSIGDFDPSDSVVTLTPNGGYRIFLHKMSQCNSLPSLVTLSACDSVLFDGQYYTSSGLYPLLYQNASGCDSLVELNIDIRQSNAYAYAATACLSFTDPSGTTWDTSGIYTLTLTNTAGCDSVVTVDLTIEEIDTTVIQSGDTLWPQSPSVLYIWIDCNTGNPVVFSGLPYFVPTSSGNYAVVLQFGNGCQDTSSCHQVTLTGVNELMGTFPFLLRPNPGEGLFLWNSELVIDEVEVFDIAGRKMMHCPLNRNENSLDLRTLANGYYLLVATGPGKSKRYGKVEIQK